MHFNVWLDGEYVDPFAMEGETSLWLDGNDPKPGRAATPRGPVTTEWNETAVGDAIAFCTDTAVREELRREPDLGRRAMNVIF